MLSYQQQQHLLRRGTAPMGQVSVLTFMCSIFAAWQNVFEKIKLNHAPKIYEQEDLRFPVQCLV